MSTPQKSKEESGASQSFMTHRSGISLENENWDVINNRWHAWYKALLADTMCTPTVQQREVIQNIHLRTKYEFFVENSLPLTNDVHHMTPHPMCHLIHGLPGASKSRLLQWLESYWETVWKYERGIHFAFVAYSNSMADNINGFTIHSFFGLPWKTNDGKVVNTSDVDDRTTFVTKNESFEICGYRRSGSIRIGYAQPNPLQTRAELIKTSGIP